MNEFSHTALLGLRRVAERGASARRAVDLRFLRRLSCAWLVAVISISTSQSAYSCGLGWNLPESHFADVQMSPFADVDNLGNLFLVQKLGDVESAKGQSLPLYAVFKSESGNRSPFLGCGWSVPFLESTMAPVDDKRFRLFQPNGLSRMFWWDKKRANYLKSSGGWDAEVRGDTITVACHCSQHTSKLVFLKGRLSSLQASEGKFDYVYRDGRLAEIREGAHVILKVEISKESGGVRGFTLLKGKKIELERGQRPRVLAFEGGEKTVAGTDLSLSRAVLADGEVRTFAYGVDKDLNPTLKLDDREIAWNAATTKVLRDGEWTYSIKPGEYALENAAIGRSNQLNQREFWHKNDAKGEEITEGIDGARRIATRFTSGKLRWRLRKEEEIRNGVKKTLCEYSYNEKGLLMRMRKADQDMFFVYEANDHMAAIIENGKIVVSYTKNAASLAKNYVK